MYHMVHQVPGLPPKPGPYAMVDSWFSKQSGDVIYTNTSTNVPKSETFFRLREEHAVPMNIINLYAGTRHDIVINALVSKEAI